MLFQAITKESFIQNPGSEWEGITKLQGKGNGKGRPLIWAINAISLPKGGCIYRLICKYGAGNGKIPPLRVIFFFSYGVRKVNL